ncbi:hypothetical protein HanLR1_Chr13g0491071 [Helianthus annuus]|nr:hypothetical protein HanLR1_Chr13g0491071 [Helianthus annuus]
MTRTSFDRFVKGLCFTLSPSKETGLSTGSNDESFQLQMLNPLRMRSKVTNANQQRVGLERLWRWVFGKRRYVAKTKNGLDPEFWYVSFTKGVYRL